MNFILVQLPRSCDPSEVDGGMNTSISGSAPGRAWYGAAISQFLAAKPAEVFASLAGNPEFTLLATQKDAWLEQIAILGDQLAGIDGNLFLEFAIPRMGRRIDAVVVVPAAVFVLEFKVGESRFDRDAIDQVWDYALDLKNFHEASHEAKVVPILIATRAMASQAVAPLIDSDGTFRPICIARNQIRETLLRVLGSNQLSSIDINAWATAPYRPTPTIIEAARALYGRHSVQDIARHDAETQNLRETSRRIEELVDEARSARRKVICFVTGVPGAGKTLVGLNIATHRRDTKDPTHAVFLSGNGPLVAVLREALARDEVVRRRSKGERVRKGVVVEKVKTFIQNVHHFRDDVLVDPRPPSEHVVIFDEAQRAWNLNATAAFMQRKKGRPGFNQSEPEFLIRSMDRHDDWSVVVCLVGGGQEINRGEAGIAAWLDAVGREFPNWDVYVSSRLHESEYASSEAIQALKDRPGIHFDDRLHLAVSMRSFRAENVSAFVRALLDVEVATARRLFSSLAGRFPVFLTRDLTQAKGWIRSRARGSERYGLVASSKAQRLKPHAIDVRVSLDPVHWFLAEREDTRSSSFLEDAATEFQVQGLELDWTCVTWDGDLRFTGNGWSFHDFAGDRWRAIHVKENRNYLKNAYRVLLTRARQGMVVFVPPGDLGDTTRAPEIYDPIYEYLRSVGIPDLV